MHRLKKGIKVLVLACITCLLGGYLLNGSDAQDQEQRAERGPRNPGGPGEFDPEEMERVWILQADSVSSALGLDEATTDKVAEAYSDARQGLQEKMMEARESGGGWEGFREMRNEAAEGLKTTLGSTLSSEQAAQAFESLGGFSFRTDMGANTLSEILDDRGKLLPAVAILMKSEGNRPRGPRGRGSGGPPGNGRGDREAQAEKLYQELGSVLSPEQLEEFKSSLDRFGRRGPRGGGGEGRRPRPQ